VAVGALILGDHRPTELVHLLGGELLDRDEHHLLLFLLVRALPPDADGADAGRVVLQL
jgi:hypothetical protein